ncbi:hypothetical protein KIN20_005547 [Parelaphostrongylus tenuis]|uniref:Uncharacterized protein n=1 Tax=Parelaphostrongylus tenuis TaxID=148309 RepID=A0AAD5M0A4_PARTN|nr:hypothetical protein KIN20_005547 [Parelaphostrongylus tenuis]
MDENKFEQNSPEIIPRHNRKGTFSKKDVTSLANQATEKALHLDGAKIRSRSVSNFYRYSFVSTTGRRETLQWDMDKKKVERYLFCLNSGLIFPKKNEDTLKTPPSIYCD